jgi:outer membrane protein OmpA-like peptidoglycan-associated protein
VSNPGDRWRKSAMVGAVGVALLAALTLGRCASGDVRDVADVSATVSEDATAQGAVETDQAIEEPSEAGAPSPDAGEITANEAELGTDTVVPEIVTEAPIEVTEEVTEEVALDAAAAEVAAIASETTNVAAEPVPEPVSDSAIAATEGATEPTTTLAAPTTTTTVQPTLEAQGTIALEGVQFNLGSARLSAESGVVLDRLVTTLTDNPSLNITISGHTDNTGDAGFNKTLSASRAKSVLDYLAKKGISADRLTAVGLGDTQPRANNGTQAGRRQNRRIEVTAE